MHIIDICKQKLHQFRFQGEHNLTVTIVNILSSIWFYVNTPIEHCNKLTRLLSLQGGDLLLETGILGLLVREVALHLPRGASSRSARNLGVGDDVLPRFPQK